MLNSLTQKKDIFDNYSLHEHMRICTEGLDAGKSVSDFVFVSELRFNQM